MREKLIHWADDITNNIILEVAKNNNIHPVVAAKMIDDAFKAYKISAKKKTLPQIKIGSFLVIKANMSKLKTRILRLSTNINSKTLIAIERYEAIIDREQNYKNLSKREKYELFLKWDQMEQKS